MQSAHFLIWCGITGLVVGLGVLAWCVVQLRRANATTSERIDRVLAQVLAAQIHQGTVDSGFDGRISGLQSWASSWTSFHENLAKRNDGERDEFNKRLIQLETENKNTPPKKRDDEDDPFFGPRSWSAQAAAAERGERFIA